MTAQPLILYVGGSGRSGSTLIDLLLNAHELVQSAGEVHRLNLYAREDTEPCTCGQPVAHCPFWLEVENEVRSHLGWKSERHPLRETDIMLVPRDVGRIASIIQRCALIVAPDPIARWLNQRVASPHHLAIEQAMVWYDAIRKVTNTRILIDSTKDTRRFKLLYLAAPEQFRLLHMVRDGRAVAASAIRRTGVSMKSAARNWVWANKKTFLARKSIPSSKIIQVHYEQLCRDPEATLRSLCDFLGLEFQSAMLSLEKLEAHNIGGNPMRFRTDERVIKLDEVWRDQLSREQLTQFDQVAGSMNRRLGYAE